MDSKRECESNRGGERERGVSDIVAFTLTFAIIITGVGLVSTVALEPITDFSDRQDVVNSERGFQAAATTIEELSRGGGVYEQVDIVPGDGNLYLARQQPVSTGMFFGNSVGNEGGLLFFTSEPSLQNKFDSLNDSVAGGKYDLGFLAVETNSLLNRFDEGSYVGYQAGAVFRSDAAGMSYEPPVEFRQTPSGDVSAYVSIVNLVPGENVTTASGFNSDVAIGPTQVPSGTPVTAANSFASFEVERTNVAQVTESVGATGTPFEFSLRALDARDIAEDNWLQYFQELSEGFAPSELRAEEQSLPSGDTVPALVCESCQSVTLRVVDIRLSQLE
jgi:hypothetical protein